MLNVEGYDYHAAVKLVTELRLEQPSEMQLRMLVDQTPALTQTSNGQPSVPSPSTE